VISSFLAVTITIILNLLMVGPFGYWGLALGTSLAATFNALFLLNAVQTLIQEGGGTFAIRPLAVSFAKHLGIALAMGGICWISHRALDSALPEDAFALHAGKIGLVLIRGVRVGLLISEGLLIVLILSKGVGATETTDALQLFAGKLKKKLSRPRN
jgi:peptidoglycan biosynthesis protein MviN/MurJ (putative lipid II flippase)